MDYDFDAAFFAPLDNEGPHEHPSNCKCDGCIGDFSNADNAEGDE